MHAWSEVMGGFWVGSRTWKQCKSLKLWSHPPGSNRRPADYESSKSRNSITYTEGH